MSNDEKDLEMLHIGVYAECYRGTKSRLFKGNFDCDRDALMPEREYRMVLVVESRRMGSNPRESPFLSWLLRVLVPCTLEHSFGFLRHLLFYSSARHARKISRGTRSSPRRPRGSFQFAKCVFHSAIPSAKREWLWGAKKEKEFTRRSYKLASFRCSAGPPRDRFKKSRNVIS